MTDFETHPVGTQKRLDAMDDLLEAMRKLNNAAYEAARIAAGDKAPQAAVLYDIARDVDCLIDHGVTVAEFEQQQRLYEGAKLAGLTA